MIRVRATVKSPTLIEVKDGDLSQYIGKDITARITKAVDGRSLEANSYFHVLVHLMAEANGTSDLAMKNIELEKYGQEDDEMPHVWLRLDVDHTKVSGLHLRLINADWDMDSAEYAVIRGSSTYDTTEMSQLIDGTVEDAKDCGVETLPPDEIRRMEAAWQAQGTAHGKREQGQRTI